MAQEKLTEDDDIKNEQELDEDIEIVVKGEEKPTDGEQEDEPEEKKAIKPHKDDDESEDEDDEDEESEEAIRERRRREKLARKERREKAMARDKVEMTFLRQRNEELEKRMMAQELRSHRQDHYTVEQRIEEAENEARTAENIIAKAIAEANGDDAAKAIRIRDEALDRIRQLVYYRDKLAKEEKEFGENRKTQVDPVVNSYAQDWISRHSWYDPQGRDLDSRIVLAIDQSLVDEGYLPKTPQYWKELDRRVKAKLSHRFNDESSYDDDEDDSLSSRSTNTQKRFAKNSDRRDDQNAGTSQPNRVKKGPPIGQSSDSVGQGKKREIYISPERKEALVQAGVWDDPVLRMRYIKRYQAWDKENASR